MPRNGQGTRVFLGDLDVTASVAGVSLTAVPNEPNQALVAFYLDAVDTDADGNLTFRLEDLGEAEGSG